MYDAIIAGARVAGAPTAMLLARLGYRVLLVDRDRFPSDTLSTHYIHQPGVAKLKEWGLLERVLATGCPPIRQVTTVRASVALSGMASYAGIDFTLCPRRTALDGVLVEAAVEAGAELRDGFVVEDLLWEAGEVAGIRGHRKGGATVEERARIVIGADGVHSPVARAVGAAAYNERPPLACAYYAYYRGVSMAAAEVHWHDDCILFGFPTNDGETCVAVEWPHARFGEVKQDPELAMAEALTRSPEFAARVGRGQRVGRVVGAGNVPNFFREAHGPGWALVGDAGYHKDPVTGLGITDAFIQAGLLAEAINAGFVGRAPLAAALADYAARRDERALPLYELTMQLVSFGPTPPEMVMLLRALQGNQADTDRYIGLLGGITPLAEFMASENLGRIIAAAARASVAV